MSIVFPLYLLNINYRWVSGVKPPDPTMAGLLALLSIYAFYVGVTADLAIWNVAVGEDGRASTSKLQAFLWTAVVFFAYVAFLDARWAAGAIGSVPDIPQNVLIAMGVSLGTATAAAAITSSNTSAGKEVKTPATRQGIGPIFQSDAGRPDLGNIQLMAWTFVALAAFLGVVFQKLATASTQPGLPDIDTSLMALTG